MGPNAGLWVESRDLHQIVVVGNGNVAFDYFVNGVRRGFAGLKCIHENHAYVPETRGVPYGTQYRKEHCRILVENGILNPDFTDRPAQAASASGVSPRYIARPGEREELPWHLTEPMPYHPPVTARSKPAVAATVGLAPVQLPKSGDVEAWVKAKASARADGFELWVEPPAALKKRLIAVAYESGAKSAAPRVQESREPSTGFRVRFAGSACADQITLTLKFDDGQTRKVAVDGCKLSG